MSRVFISGSTTGLGLMVGELLISQSHQVVLHARNTDRAEEARRAFPKAEAIVIGDLEIHCRCEASCDPGQYARPIRCCDP